MPHRLEYGPAALDLIPYSRSLVSGDALEWPGQDRVLSTLGFEEAFESARPSTLEISLSRGPQWRPACCSSSSLTTTRPAERARDLIDIVHCFELYGDEPDGRRDDIGEPEVDGTPVSYDEAGAHLLGREVVVFPCRESLAAGRAVLASIDDEHARPVEQLLSEERRRFDDGARRRALHRLFRVFAVSVERLQA